METEGLIFSGREIQKFGATEAIVRSLFVFSLELETTSRPWSENLEACWCYTDGQGHRCTQMPDYERLYEIRWYTERGSDINAKQWQPGERAL